MQIKNLFTGIVTNERADIARALIRQGLAEALNPKDLQEDAPAGPPKGYKPGSAAQPHWEVGTYPLPVSGGAELRIVMQILGQTYFYNGHPDRADARATWDGGFRYLNGLGRAVPDDILAEYKRQWKSNSNIRGVSPMYGAETVKAFSAASNRQMAVQKEEYDKEVKAGNVPHTTSTVLETPQD